MVICFLSPRSTNIQKPKINIQKPKIAGPYSDHLPKSLSAADHARYVLKYKQLSLLGNALYFLRWFLVFSKPIFSPIDSKQFNQVTDRNYLSFRINPSPNTTQLVIQAVCNLISWATHSPSNPIFQIPPTSSCINPTDHPAWFFFGAVGFVAQTVSNVWSQVRVKGP